VGKDWGGGKEGCRACLGRNRVIIHSQKGVSQFEGGEGKGDCRQKEWTTGSTTQAVAVEVMWGGRQLGPGLW